MSRNKKSRNADRALKGRIDQLATRLLLDADLPDTAFDWTAELQLLVVDAQSSSRQDLAAVAGEIAAQLQNNDGTAGASLLEAGIAKLQQALERPADGEASAASAPPPQNAIACDPELIADFVLESKEHLAGIETNLLSLDKGASDGDAGEAGQLPAQGTDLETIHSVFRSFHTIKGLAGFLEMAEIQAVAHEVETVLDHARESRLVITSQVIDVVLATTDYLNQWMTHLSRDPLGAPPEKLRETKTLLERVRALMDTGPAIIVPDGVDGQTVLEPTAALPSPPETKQIEKSSETKSDGRAPAASSVKVDTGKLQYLVDMVGEMVIAQSMILHHPDLAGIQKPQLTRSLLQLARITDEVQRTAMSMRMVPIRPLFQKMARLVRDLNRKFGKETVLETFGEDVELDRSIVEELADPLMHMIRNSMDHGIEPAEDRAAACKPPIAKITLRATHMAGQIVLEVSDDGRGLDRKKIIDKAVSNGLIPAGSHLSDSECFLLIFEPGFSTAAQISAVSGRGVGMDVVKRQIQKLRGSIEIQSTQGQGSSFFLKLPLTMAIIDGLVIIAGQDRYIVPIFAVKEMLRPTPEMLSTVENRVEVLLVREMLLPVIRLYKRFHLKPRSTNPQECVFVICEVDGKLFALMVDDLVGKQEVVIKGLGQVFQKVSGIAGGAILGDGRIGLILDIKSLFEGQLHTAPGGAIARV